MVWFTKKGSAPSRTTQRSPPCTHRSPSLGKIWDRACRTRRLSKIWRCFWGRFNGRKKESLKKMSKGGDLWIYLKLFVPIINTVCPWTLTWLCFGPYTTIRKASPLRVVLSGFSCVTTISILFGTTTSLLWIYDDLWMSYSLPRVLAEIKIYRIFKGLMVCHAAAEGTSKNRVLVFQPLMGCRVTKISPGLNCIVTACLSQHGSFIIELKPI